MCDPSKEEVAYCIELGILYIPPIKEEVAFAEEERDAYAEHEGESGEDDAYEAFFYEEEERKNTYADYEEEEKVAYAEYKKELRAEETEESFVPIPYAEWNPNTEFFLEMESEEEEREESFCTSGKISEEESLVHILYIYTYIYVYIGINKHVHTCTFVYAYA
jgi:hypothetical protein